MRFTVSHLLELYSIYNRRHFYKANPGRLQRKCYDRNNPGIKHFFNVSKFKDAGSRAIRKTATGCSIRSRWYHYGLRSISQNAIQYYFTFGYIPSPLSIYKGVYKLEAVYALQYNSGGLKTWPFWDVSLDNQSKLSETELDEKLEELFIISVKNCINSDTPVGALLSGGIDSNLVTAAKPFIKCNKNIYSWIRRENNGNRYAGRAANSGSGRPILRYIASKPLNF